MGVCLGGLELSRAIALKTSLRAEEGKEIRKYIQILETVLRFLNIKRHLNIT